MMQSTLANPNTPQPIFITRMYDETLTLLTDAHAYFSYAGATDRAQYGQVERLIYTAEMSRITLRLSSVMAWLLAQRAEHAGQITREEANEHFSLSHVDICLQQMAEMRHTLPSAMCDLLERSYNLFNRALRLEGMLTEEEMKPVTVH